MRDTESAAMVREHDKESNEMRMIHSAAMKRRQARPGTLLRGERIKGDDEPYPVEEAREFRMRLLAMSLYPNVYSGLAMTHMGPS